MSNSESKKSYIYFKSTKNTGAFENDEICMKFKTAHPSFTIQIGYSKFHFQVGDKGELIIPEYGFKGLTIGYDNYGVPALIFKPSIDS